MPRAAKNSLRGGVYTLQEFWGRQARWGPLEGLEKGVGHLKG